MNFSNMLEIHNTDLSAKGPKGPIMSDALEVSLEVGAPLWFQFPTKRPGAPGRLGEGKQG